MTDITLYIIYQVQGTGTYSSEFYNVLHHVLGGVTISQEHFLIRFNPVDNAGLPTCIFCLWGHTNLTVDSSWKHFCFLVKNEIFVNLINIREHFLNYINDHLHWIIPSSNKLFCELSFITFLLFLQTIQLDTLFVCRPWSVPKGSKGNTPISHSDQKVIRFRQIVYIWYHLGIKKDIENFSFNIFLHFLGVRLWISNNCS